MPSTYTYPGIYVEEVPSRVRTIAGVGTAVGFVVHEAAGAINGDVRLGHPSGVLPLDASVVTRNGQPWAERVTVYRTARRLMEGLVRVP